ncbi:UNVERIFIED_CONTAM: Type I inositol polyphosphate 5-phosphatase 4 [Sesamum radiatum]|uniref:Type I inositol polyphosphate 5-phosphatase 4 n=1 Tax=Sesamum radiatum TaxID=300843 RepID=A0AAW2URG5_SESRA
MRDGNSKKKFSWPKTLVKKWFNIKSKNEDFHADDIIYGGNFFRQMVLMKNGGAISQRGRHAPSRKVKPQRNQQDEILTVPGEVKLTLMPPRLLMCITTGSLWQRWNVAGKSPPSYLNLEEWLHTSPPADIYVLGFQEIVPLNAGNVLGTEDNGPARKWLALIRKTLNSLPGSSGSCRTPSPIPIQLLNWMMTLKDQIKRRHPLFYTAVLSSR